MTNPIHRAFRWGILTGLAIAAILWALAAIAQAAAHSATLTWTASSDAGPGLTYNVYRATGACSASSSFTQQATAIATTTWTDSAPIVGTSCYQVTATLNGAESVPSNQAQAVILPSPPSGLTASGK